MADAPGNYHAASWSGHISCALKIALPCRSGMPPLRGAISCLKKLGPGLKGDLGFL